MLGLEHFLPHLHVLPSLPSSLTSRSLPEALYGHQARTPVLPADAVLPALVCSSVFLSIEESV